MSTETALAGLTREVKALNTRLDTRLFELVRAVHQTNEHLETMTNGMSSVNESEKIIKRLDRIADAIEMRMIE